MLTKQLLNKLSSHCMLLRNKAVSGTGHELHAIACEDWCHDIEELIERYNELYELHTAECRDPLVNDLHKQIVRLEYSNCFLKLTVGSMVVALLGQLVAVVALSDWHW